MGARVFENSQGSIPLALELAAARVRVMTPEDIALRLDQRFSLLTGGRRTASERHQTLRRTIDWSYDLLEDGLRLALDRLSVFVGGFTLGAAEAVISGEGIEAGNVLDLLIGLVDRSLVVNEQVSGGLVGIATVSAAAGNGEASQRHLDEAFSIAREFDLSLALGDAYLVRADLRLRAGDAERADDDAQEALRTFSAAGAKPGMVRSLEMLGEIAAAAESYEEAARLLSGGDALRATIGFERYPVAEAAYDDARAGAQTALGTEAFDAAAAEGATLTLDDLVAYARRAQTAFQRLGQPDANRAGGGSRRG